MPRPEMRCLKCGYIVDHLPEPRCPECGLEFDPANPRTYRLGRPTAAGTPWIVAAVVGAGLPFAFWITNGFAWYPRLLVAAVTINFVVVIRSVVALALVGRDSKGNRAKWAAALIVNFLALLGWGDDLVTLQVTWGVPIFP